MVNGKTIRERVIEIAGAVIEEEFAAIVAADRLGFPADVADTVRQRIKASLDGIGDCRTYEKMNDKQIRGEVAPPLRKLVREALASRRPS